MIVGEERVDMEGADNTDVVIGTCELTIGAVCTLLITVGAEITDPDTTEEARGRWREESEAS